MPANKENFLLTIVGPTAIGKTALSIQLAQHFNAEIISCDSRQFYKEMAIGTAVPDTSELAAAPHHFIQNRSVLDSYNVGDFEKDALQKLATLFTKNNIVIMVGGSGLYVDAVIKGLDYFPKVDPQIRQDLNEKLSTNGLTSLQDHLKALDLETYNNIALDNPQRVIRALEVCIGTNKPYASFKNKPKEKRNFTSLKIGLDANREIIYQRINQRVDIMMLEGLLKEVTGLLPYKNLNALQTVGYKELFSYLEGNITKDFAIEEIKKNTRRFAKRQLTWFRKDASIQWFDYETPLEKILKTLNKSL